MEDSYTDKFFTEDSLDAFMTELSKHSRGLDRDRFKQLIFVPQWNKMFIMNKMRHLTRCMHEVLPDSFEDTVEILIKAAPQVKWWENVSLPEYIALYGLDHWDKSMEGLAKLAPYGACEFSIRPFLVKDPEKATAFLEDLTTDESEEVRRFASESCRPSHPWGIGLPLFKRDPSLILPILEKLKDDESEYVRRSVANNLNAISKDNPEIVLEIAERWHGKTSRTDWLVKHACRTLLKKGNRRTMALFGFGNTDNLEISDFHFDKESIDLGERMNFSFELDVKAESEILVRLEFGIHYLKANGSSSRKVFKISEKSHQPGSHKITKRTSHFKDRTTRTLYEGTQAISIIVNGVEMGKREFILIK